MLSWSADLQLGRERQGGKLRKGLTSTLLCEYCVTECCAVVQSTTIAMGAVPISINNFSYL